MIVETKYNIGDRVWIVYEQSLYTDSYKGPAGEATVFSDKIIGIIVDEDKSIVYEIEAEGADWIKEDDIIFYGDDEALLKKIKELDDEIRKREGKE